MAFFQTPPALGNQYDDDRLLKQYLGRTLPPDVLSQLEGEYSELGDLSADLLHEQVADRLNEPVHTPYDPWGNRIDHIEVSPLWKKAQIISAERGMVAAGYEGTYGALSRVHQFAMNYIVQPSLDVYSCPLAMTDGAARTLLDSGNTELIDRAVPRLTSRDPDTMWTSGQWMTERTGGSDVGKSETVARKDDDGQWRLYGTKWFTSATTSEMALTLGRPDGNGPGGRGLALFYLELRDGHGLLRNITVNRLKDKLGTRKVPTAELELLGTEATLVGEAKNGVRAITPMLNITRTWNAICAASGMRRAVALARDYAGRREAFGAALADKPLHVDTLAAMEAETAGATLLAFRSVELLGRKEAGEASDADLLLLRAMTPITKLTTGKQAVAVASEALECFGGAGYVEDTGLPRLLADAQVLPIWEGTTNVLSLDLLRALAGEGTLQALSEDIGSRLATVTASELGGCVDRARSALGHATEWVAANLAERDAVEAGARRFAMTLGRTLELALLCEHAQWCVDKSKEPAYAIAAARRFAAHGVDRITDIDANDAAALA